MIVIFQIWVSVLFLLKCAVIFLPCYHYLFCFKDISLILEDYMETEFNTILEDGSPDELGELLVTMWRQCGEGDFTLVTNALAREYVRHEGMA